MFTHIPTYVLVCGSIVILLWSFMIYLVVEHFFWIRKNGHSSGGVGDYTPTPSGVYESHSSHCDTTHCDGGGHH